MVKLEAEYSLLFCSLSSDPEVIFLTDGASKGVMQILSTIIRGDRDGVIQIANDFTNIYIFFLVIFYSKLNLL